MTSFHQVFTEQKLRRHLIVIVEIGKTKGSVVEAFNWWS